MEFSQQALNLLLQPEITKNRDIGMKDDNAANINRSESRESLQAELLVYQTSTNYIGNYIHPDCYVSCLLKENPTKP